MKTRVNNQLAEIRKGRGIGQSGLAAKVGVSRQTIHAIETGEYVPNTEVALRLAQELEVTVDQLFSLPRPLEKVAEDLTVESVSEAPLEPGARFGSARWARAGWRSGERVAVLSSGSRRHRRTKPPAQRPRRRGGFRGRRSFRKTFDHGRDAIRRAAC